MIMLAGIVVNNAIVHGGLRQHAAPARPRLEEALVEAGSVRLRPILMTTATTVLGLLPMSLGLGDGAEIRTPMALTVIAGLVSSTLLTLVVLPTAYAALESARDSPAVDPGAQASPGRTRRRDGVSRRAAASEKTKRPATPGCPASPSAGR